ncbi:hypothetical protein EV356DRAFT_529238 [Viridothelium virens]|uniref:Uncharacterized protein n=1 Tax=Viridothelium virens TaxID=1048519 RepID=A0A6A6HK95_VIRVR|nr:hypothetical protein EV356DRAFT_529238 [Viridothelium virens]
MASSPLSWKRAIEPLFYDLRIPLEEFKEDLNAITDEYTNNEIYKFYDRYYTAGLGILYLGSRGEFEYGIWTNGTDEVDTLDLTEDYPYTRNLPDQQGDTHFSLKIGSAYFINNTNSRGISSEKNNMTGQDISSETIQTDDDDSEQSSSLLQNTTTETRAEVEERLSKMPDIRRFIEIGSLVTYSVQENWSDTRFSVVKSLDNNQLWIIARPWFQELDDHHEDEEYEVTEPQLRTYPLDGFHDSFSCARLKADIESLQHDEGMQQENASRTVERKEFAFEQVHRGGFVLAASKYVV